MSEIIERVARAAYESLFNGEWPDVGTSISADGFRTAARAAIEAMREPTDEMKNCSEEVHWGYSCHVCGGLTEGWYKMIDAALREK